MAEQVTKSSPGALQSEALDKVASPFIEEASKIKAKTTLADTSDIYKKVISTVESGFTYKKETTKLSSAKVYHAQQVTVDAPVPKMRRQTPLTPDKSLHKTNVEQTHETEQNQTTGRQVTITYHSPPKKKSKDKIRGKDEEMKQIDKMAEIAAIVPSQFQSIEKARSIPIVNTATDIFASLYLRVKDIHPVVHQTLNFCETATVNLATPLLANFEKPLGTADNYACQGIDYVAHRFPVITKPTQEIVETVVEPATRTFQGMKTYGTETVTTIVQKQADMVLNNKAAKAALNTLETGLKGANHLMDQYYPLEGEEKEGTTAKDTQSSEASTENATETSTTKAMLIFGLMLQLNSHVYSVAKKQVKQFHSVAMLKLDQLTGVITLLENAKAEGKPSDKLLQRARELSGSLLSFYSGAQKIVFNLPGIFSTSLSLVREQAQELYNVFAKAENISDIRWNMLTFAQETVKKIRGSLANIYAALRENEEESKGQELNNMSSEDKKSL